MTEEGRPNLRFRKIWILAGSLVLLSGAVAFRYLRLSEPFSVREEARGETTIIHLNPFTVNLGDERQHTFLRIGIDVGVARKEAAKGGSADLSSAPIRDTLLEILTSSSCEEIALPDGKKRLKQQMLKQLNERIPSLHAQEIYFTEFLIQR